MGWKMLQGNSLGGYTPPKWKGQKFTVTWEKTQLNKAWPEREVALDKSLGQEDPNHLGAAVAIVKMKEPLGWTLSIRILRLPGDVGNTRIQLTISFYSPWEIRKYVPPAFWLVLLFELQLMKICLYNSCWHIPRADNSPSTHEHQGDYFHINGMKQNTSIVIELGASGCQRHSV